MDDEKVKVPIFERVLAFWFLYTGTMFILGFTLVAVHAFLFEMSLFITTLMWYVITLWAIILVIVIILFIGKFGFLDDVRQLCNVVRGKERLE